MKGAVLMMAASLAVLASAGSAQEETGRGEYMVACAGCHGESGLGNGPLAELLTIEVPSLTTLAAEKGDGVFPFEYVLRMVDGRQDIRAHGSAMPIWGERFQYSATSRQGEAPDMVARGRILSLVYYVDSIQQ